MLLLTLTVHAADPQGASLSRLARLAEENSPVIRKQRAFLEQAELELKNARSQFLPWVSLESNLGPTGSDPSEPDKQTNIWTSNAILKATEKLYDNGESITNYKRALNTVEQKRIEFELERDAHFLKLAGTFYDWSSAWQDRRISENKRDLLRRQFNILEAQYKQGLKTKRDVLRIETEVRRLQIDLLRKDNELEVLIQRLCAQAGIDPETLKQAGIETEEARIDAPIPMGPWPELKVADHRRAKIFERRSRDAELQSRLKERSYLPQVFLTGEVSAGYYNFYEANTFNTDFWGWSTMLTLKYTLWDWGTQSRDLQIARINERHVKADNEQEALDLNIELRDVWLKLREYAESAKMTKELLTLEQQSYNILEAEYRNGRTTYLDLITNLNSLIDARSRYASNFFSLKKQQATYAYHKGTLYEELKPK